MGCAGRVQTSPAPLRRLRHKFTVWACRGLRQCTHGVKVARGSLMAQEDPSTLQEHHVSYWDPPVRARQAQRTSV